MLDTSSRASVRAAEKAAKRFDVDEAEVIRSIMSSPAGRYWIWTRLESAHIFSTTFTDSPTRSAFLEGERNAGLTLLNAVMSACPDLYTLAMREANERRIATDNAISRVTASQHAGSQDPDGGDQGPADGPGGWDHYADEAGGTAEV